MKCVMQSGSRSSKAPCRIYLHHQSPIKIKIKEVRRYRSNSKFLLKSQCATTTPNFAHVQIRALFNKKHNAKAPPRTNISYIITPTMSLLNRIDSDQEMTAAECLEAIHDDVARFEAMLLNPAVFEANAPDVDAKAYIELHESFHLLEPLQKRLGKWVSWKCMC